MTREEAIICLKGIKNYGRDTFTEQTNWQDCLDMAIKALEIEPCDDAISRQSVLNACEQSINILEAVDRIMDLPSVNPQVSCGDAVSRQAALDAMYELCNTGENLEENPWRDNPHIDAITDAINNLQPVNPQEPKTGHWIDRHIIANRTFDMIVCSECGNEFSFDAETGISEYNYCPNCGAKMVEPQESEEKDADSN